MQSPSGLHPTIRGQSVQNSSMQTRTAQRSTDPKSIRAEPINLKRNSIEPICSESISAKSIRTEPHGQDSNMGESNHKGTSANYHSTESGGERPDCAKSNGATTFHGESASPGTCSAGANTAESTQEKLQRTAQARRERRGHCGEF